MLPILLDLKFVKIYTFGVFLVLAFFWGSYLLWRLIRLTALKEEEVFDGLFWGLAGGLFFGRLFYVLLNFKDFGFNLLKFILINGYPGLSLYGCVFGGFLTLVLYLTAKKINVREAVDYFIAPFFVSLGFGKLGSFFGGVEVGTKTKFILAIKYVGFDGLRHLTPFYEAILFFVGAYFSHRLIFEIRKERLIHGFNFLFMVWYLALVYLIFDGLKMANLYLGRQSFNQLVSLILVLTVSGYFLYYFRVVILKKTGMLISYFYFHGKKTGQKIYHFAERKIRKRTRKNSSTD